MRYAYECNVAFCAGVAGQPALLLWQALATCGKRHEQRHAPCGSCRRALVELRWCCQPLLDHRPFCGFCNSLRCRQSGLGSDPAQRLGARAMAGGPGGAGERSHAMPCRPAAAAVPPGACTAVPPAAGRWPAQHGLFNPLSCCHSPRSPPPQLLHRPHYLLATLLLCNAAAMEALPIFLDRLLNPVAAVVISGRFGGAKGRRAEHPRACEKRKRGA